MIECPFAVGDRVHDDVTGKEDVIVGITYSEGFTNGNRNCNQSGNWGIWLQDTKVYKGGRQDWEVSKV